MTKDQKYIEQYFIYIDTRKYVKFNDDNTYTLVDSMFKATHFSTFNEVEEKAKLVREENQIYKFLNATLP